MGYYIETPLPTAKALQLIELYGALPYDGTFEDVPEGKVAVCAVQNGLFDAVGILYDDREFAAFTEPDDKRPKDLLLLDKNTVLDLCPSVAREFDLDTQPGT